MTPGTIPANGAGLTQVLVGEQFGADARYMLLRLVGAGGMASVWVASDSRSGGEVAVKILSDALALDPAFVQRFEREARLAAQLAHPNVVRVLDHHTGGARPYLVMEHVAGGTLADRLRSGPLDRWDLHELTQDLLGTLSYLHQAGVLHRDLKPANVLLGTDGRLRLTDFGIAQLEGASRITGVGELVGTQSYLAPEVLAGDSAAVVTDLYSCGVLLSECAGPDAPAPLLDLIGRLTSPDPGHRPASAAEAIALLASATDAAAVDFPPLVVAAERAADEPTEIGPPIQAGPGRPAGAPLPPPPPTVHLPPRPAEPPPAYRVRRRPPRRYVVAALVVPVVFAIAAFGVQARDGGADAGTQIPAPTDGPLSQQLDDLDHAIDLVGQ